MKWRLRITQWNKQTKSWFFENLSKIEKLLDKLKETWTNQIRHGKDSHSKFQWYLKKFMDTSEIYCPDKWKKQEKLMNVWIYMSYPSHIYEIEAVTRSFQVKRNLGPNSFTT